MIVSLFRCEICGFRRGDYEDGYCTKGCDAVKFGKSVSMFGKTVFSPLAGSCQ